MNENKTMKELPVSEKPYEKCLEQGPQMLTDTELLAVILRTGSTGMTALGLSREILKTAPGEQGLLGLYRVSILDLMQIHGVGKVKAIQIKCILELSRRLAKQTAKNGLQFRDPETIASYYMEDFRHSGQEEMQVMMLDTRNKMVGEVAVSKGTVNAALVSPREIFLEALHFHAVSIVLVHNHPSGDPSPSRDDLNLTKRIQKAGQMLGIELLDHIVIGDRKYVSFRESGILDS
ncbi:MAG: DNA repair protein RadC [Lachnospiraceae bacterium]|jgi:DNA repair protein RadC|nr:DNA repair protein RadC [Lachnospiraceae bacterium]